MFAMICLRKKNEYSKNEYLCVNFAQLEMTIKIKRPRIEVQRETELNL